MSLDALIACSYFTAPNGIALLALALPASSHLSLRALRGVQDAPQHKGEQGYRNR
jgi:hypothetical protein